MDEEQLDHGDGSDEDTPNAAPIVDAHAQRTPAQHARGSKSSLRTHL